MSSSSELATVRAYEAGSDHHLTSDNAYFVVRASSRPSPGARCTTPPADTCTSAACTSTPARSAEIDGRAVKLSRLEFERLCQFASDPTRVFAKAEPLGSPYDLVLIGRFSGTCGRRRVRGDPA
jgi:DNA-binding response OmpR family regulator